MSGKAKGSQARKKQKEVERRKKKARQRTAASPIGAQTRIMNARKYPLHKCYINPDWREQGIAHVVVSRMQTNGQITFGVYLVDVGCLGAKDAFCNANFPESAFRERFEESEQFVPCDAALAHQIIYGGIRWAEKAGFTPHHDFGLARLVLDEESRFEPNPDIEFGKDGKHFYIGGPYDDQERIVAQLEATLGENNYHYIVGGPLFEENAEGDEDLGYDEDSSDDDDDNGGDDEYR
ncbi:MAG: hypothetical protein NTW86_30160 [Candidatus Sumerlaeota bacterium]|nr:hypothetical protein [Candidatus Sumerlaeota bacterium]